MLALHHKKSDPEISLELLFKLAVFIHKYDLVAPLKQWYISLIADYPWHKTENLVNDRETLRLRLGNVMAISWLFLDESHFKAVTSEAIMRAKIDSKIGELFVDRLSMFKGVEYPLSHILPDSVFGKSPGPMQLTSVSNTWLFYPDKNKQKISDPNASSASPRSARNSIASCRNGNQKSGYMTSARCQTTK